MEEAWKLGDVRKADVWGEEENGVVRRGLGCVREGGGRGDKL